MILASISLPQFRLRWLDEAKKETARALLYESVQSVDIVEQTVERAPESGSVSVSASQKDDFFCFDSLPTENTDARAQVDMLLTDTSRDIDCLHKKKSHKCPLSKKLF